MAVNNTRTRNGILGILGWVDILFAVCQGSVQESKCQCNGFLFGAKDYCGILRQLVELSVVHANGLIGRGFGEWKFVSKNDLVEKIARHHLVVV